MYCCKTHQNIIYRLLCTHARSVYSFTHGLILVLNYFMHSMQQYVFLNHTDSKVRAWYASCNNRHTYCIYTTERYPLIVINTDWSADLGKEVDKLGVLGKVHGDIRDICNVNKYRELCPIHFVRKGKRCST